jgi:hypothetical protein
MQTKYVMEQIQIESPLVIASQTKHQMQPGMQQIVIPMELQMVNRRHESIERDTDGDGVTDGKEKQITRIQKIIRHCSLILT